MNKVLGSRNTLLKKAEILIFPPRSTTNTCARSSSIKYQQEKSGEKKLYTVELFMKFQSLCESDQDRSPKKAEI